MNSKLMAVLWVGVSLIPTGLRAEPTPASQEAAASPSSWDNIKVWFQHWKDGLASSAVEGQYQQKSLTAVAAVRGDEQKLDDPNKPYIKGKLNAKQARKLKKERAELGQAVDLILAGKVDEGSKKLDEFEAKHPKSLLLGDVQKARVKLQELKTSNSASPVKS